jgi:CRISPR/Cas system CMR subunit Cmr4 (Cas7 group RAMP superfamily)
VKIDGKTRTASEEGKFNREVLPRGVQFQVKLRLMLPLVLPQWKKERPVTEEDLLAALRDVMEGFSSGGIRLGGKKTRGNGYGSVARESWSVYRWDLADRAQLLDWLGEVKAPAKGIDSLPNAPKMDVRRGMRVRCLLRLETSLLIRSGGGQLNAPDMVHFEENGEPLLPFTAVCGPLRHHCAAIAKGIWKDDGRLVRQMFGPDKGDLFASRVSGPDAGLKEVERRVQARVALDRFTGAALDAALFDEAPVWPLPLKADASQCEPGHHVAIELDLDETQRGEQPLNEVDRMAALLLIGLKDLFVGWLPLGGESSVGRGVFRLIQATVERTAMPALTIDETAMVQGWNEQWQALMPAGGKQ